VVTASDSDIAGLKAAAEPVITELREDAVTNELIDAITELKKTASPDAPITSC
jgi:hypothetical protein